MPHESTCKPGQQTADRQTSPAVPAPAIGHDWVDRFGDALYGYAVRRVGRADVAEDLVQEAMLAGVRAWPTFGGRADVGTWLTSILRHKVADHLRARYREGQRSGGPSDPHGQPSTEEDALFDARGRWREPVSAWSGDPSRMAEGRELRRAVDACLSKLPKPMAYLFVGRVEGSVPTADLCGELGITPENGWTLLHRAKLRLRRCLTDTWFNSDRSSPPQPGDA